MHAYSTVREKAGLGLRFELIPLSWLAESPLHDFGTRLAIRSWLRAGLDVKPQS